MGKEMDSCLQKKDFVEDAPRLIEVHKSYSRQCFLAAYEGIWEAEG
jgi:hypothetical protein